MLAFSFAFPSAPPTQPLHRSTLRSTARPCRNAFVNARNPRQRRPPTACKSHPPDTQPYVEPLSAQPSEQQEPEPPLSEKAEIIQSDGTSPRPTTVDLSIFGRSVSLNPRLILFVIPILWATFNPIMRFLYTLDEPPESSVFNSIRLLFSTMCFIPVFVNEFLASSPPKASSGASDASSAAAAGGGGSPLWLLGGIELGLWIFLGNVMQIFALEFDSASRAAFLIQLQTVIVPVISAAAGVEKIRASTAISSLVSVMGVLVLSLEKPAGGAVMSSLQGDALCLLSALFQSVFVLRLGKYAGRVKPALLVGSKITVQLFFSCCWIAFDVYSKHLTPGESFGSFVKGDAHDLVVIWGVVAWMGFVISALASWLQTMGQRCVPASETAVMFAMQPVWATAMAVVLLGESIGPKSILGGSMIVGATILGSLQGKEKK